MPKEISSIQNSLVKDIIKLQEKSRERKKTQRFVIEGLREVQLALKGNYQFDKILFEPSIVSIDKIQDLGNLEATEIISISSEVYKKLAYRSSTEGVLAICKTKSFSLNSLNFHSENPLILVAEAPEKPGNIGALLRTADAANVDAVIVANPKTDLYNPNIIRSSVGCIFTNVIGTGSTDEILSFLKNKQISIYSAALNSDSENYVNQDFTKSTAVVVGTEATGLSEKWLKNSTKNIIIPMLGEIDSMNVSVSAGILIYEAKRQRKFQ